MTPEMFRSSRQAGQTSGRLSGRTALVTGATGTIGRAIVARFAREGARVVVADLRLQDARAVARETARSTGIECLGIELDVSRHEDVAEAATSITSRFGVCDAIVVNAGVLTIAPALELSPEQWRSVIEVNLSGSFFTATEFARPLLSAGIPGTIVFTSSLFGLRGGRGNAAYSASKFGMIGLAQSMAAELAAEGIRVNSVCPGQIATPMLAELFAARSDASGRTLADEAALLTERIPAGRLGSAEDVSKAVLYLSSDDSDYVTGTSTLVDGGWQVG